MPVDLAVFSNETPGEATVLRLSKSPTQPGVLAIDYTPACAATDHSILMGRLEGVAPYEYSHRHCGLGIDGSAEIFLEQGSWFYLLAGANASDREGSYGTDSRAVERPPMPPGAVCGQFQDLRYRCD